MTTIPEHSGITPLRVANFLMLCACVASGVLQHNDPDPWRWMAFYTAAACVCLAFHMDKLIWQVPAALGIYALGWFFYLLPMFVGETSLPAIFSSLSMQTEDVEEAREAGGTFLVATWCLVLAQNRHREKLAQRVEKAD